MGNGQDLGQVGDQLLCVQDVTTGCYEATISTTAYLTTTDFLAYGMFIGSGGFSPGGRSTFTITLIQRTQ